MQGVGGRDPVHSPCAQGGSDLKDGLQRGTRVQSVCCCDLPATPVRVGVGAATAPLHIHVTTQQPVRGRLLALVEGCGAAGWGCAACVAPEPHASCCKGCTAAGICKRRYVMHCCLPCPNHHQQDLPQINRANRTGLHLQAPPTTHQQRACMCRSVLCLTTDSKQDPTAACTADLTGAYYYSPATQTGTAIAAASTPGCSPRSPSCC